MNSTIEINMEKDLTEAGRLLLLGMAAKLNCSPQEAMTTTVNSGGHLLFHRDLLTAASKQSPRKKNPHSKKSVTYPKEK